MLFIRSLIFNVFMYVLMLLMGIACAPLALYSRAGAHWSITCYCRIVLGALRLICGVETVVKGTVPQDEVIVAAKHQSFLDIMMLAEALPRPMFVMKKNLRWAPILGFYAMRIGCAPVDRGKRAQAVQKMVKDVETNAAQGGQVIIYPQGTRTSPGQKRPYKIGAGVLYERFGLKCVPVATNAGVFWPRLSFLRRPGTAVISFLEPIPLGMELRPFMEVLESRVERASDALLD